jgi:hypothetical protein
MTKQELELWQKIQDFQFDKPDIQLTFAKRLARENNFSESFAKQIVEEYKKFIFLCCISNHQITPSHHVDLAWHLHLTYTKSYWIDLCTNTISKEIHHNPTEGGQKENTKFRNYYKDTLELYKSKFLIEPPTNIWQEINDRFKSRIANVDTGSHWIVRKPKISSYLNYFFVLIFCSVLIGCNNVDHNAVISLLVIIIVVVIIYNLVSKAWKGDKISSSSGCSGGCSSSSHHNEADDADDASDSDGDSGCSGCGGGGD